MIRREFKKPNVRVVATPPGKSERTWLTRGESAEAVREQLEQNGWTDVKVDDFSYTAWKEKADELTRQLREAHDRGEKLEFDGKIWREMKHHLFELFDNKCAYCESLVLHISPGDVEHYRPKGRVTEDRDHPGYYWLAYDINNLLPSCSACNGSRGKWNQFPVEDGTRAATAEELDQERALLLHPYRDSFNNHLKFDHDGGVVGTSQQGECSVEVYDLDRHLLQTERRKAQEDLQREMELVLLRREVEWGEAVQRRAEKLLKGSEEYSAALLSELVRITAEESSRQAIVHNRATEAARSLGRLLED